MTIQISAQGAQGTQRGGVPLTEYGIDFLEGQAGINRAAVLYQLGTEWLPSIPDVHQRLQADPPARVADIGCGVGWSSIGISLAGAAFAFLVGETLLAVTHTVPAWVVAGCVTAAFVPFVTGSNDAIWQAKVARAVQGRVLATYGMVRRSTIPIGILLGNLMADRWIEPAMMPGGSLTPLFGSLVGTGPGAGMALMFLAAAVLGCALSLSGYLFPAVRCVEDQLLDHDLNTLPAAVAVQPA